jgi:sugar-specific transcriptional regulator TrmB
LGENSVENILKGLKLTENEVEIYVLLIKYGILKAGEIARHLKKDKAQILRILKRLQSKGLIEATLESPKRFTAVPFENIIDAFVKSKRDEAASLENAKKELISYFERFNRIEHEASPEKFVVIEGTNKIYGKILQMVNETKNQLSAVATVENLVTADRFDIFDIAFNHALKSNIEFRFLTELSEQNVGAIKALLKRMPKVKFNFKGRNPDMGLQLSPRMVTRDDQEILFFITPKTDAPSRGQQDDVCLWTNCNQLVQAFGVVFEDLWHNSIDIESKVEEIERKNQPLTTLGVADEKAPQSYEKLIRSAKEELLILTSTKGLLECWKNISLLKERTYEGLKIRIMTQIIGENQQAALELSKFCEVRHVPTSHPGTIIIDGAHLFQLNNPLLDQGELESARFPANGFYTNDSEYIEKTKTMLNNIWRNAQPPSAFNIMSAFHADGHEVDMLKDKSNRYSEYKKEMYTFKLGGITEKDVLDRIISSKKKPREEVFSKHIDTYYGSQAIGIIDPHKKFNLPRMMIWVDHYDKQSSFGAEDSLVILSWMETPRGHQFIPVAYICDNRESVAHRKRLLAGTPAAENCRLVGKEELQVRVHGNTLFAGWTVPITLYPSPHTIPPSCILFEGFGELNTGTVETRFFQRRQIWEFNEYDAFVTFIHPSSKYSGPGTDGVFFRDIIVTAYPCSEY